MHVRVAADRNGFGRLGCYLCIFTDGQSFIGNDRRAITECRPADSVNIRIRTDSYSPFSCYLCVGTEENGIIDFFTRINSDRFGIFTDSDGIICYFRVIFIAGFRSATDGNRVGTVCLRSTFLHAVLATNGNGTNPFGTCLIAESDGIHRRRFRIIPDTPCIVSRGFGLPTNSVCAVPPCFGIRTDGNRG